MRPHPAQIVRWKVLCALYSFLLDIAGSTFTDIEVPGAREVAAWAINNSGVVTVTGIGRSLLDACETEAQKHNLTLLMIGVLPKNMRARTVYRAAGFAPYAEILRKHL